MGVTRHNWPGDDQLVAGIVAAGGPNRYAQQCGMAVGTVYARLDNRRLRDRVFGLCGGRVHEQAVAARERAEEAVERVQGLRTGQQRPGADVKGDKATVVSNAAEAVGSEIDDIQAAGMNPDDWEVDRAKLNWWDAMTSDKASGDNRVVRMYQRTLQLKRRVPLDWLFPASDVAQRPVPNRQREPGDGPQLVVLLPDPHCPFHDTELDKRIGEWLHYLQPDRVISPGDVLDFSTISRHRDNPAWFAAANENIQAGFEWWAHKRDAAPDAEMDWVEGNHDARIRTELLTRAERMYGIKPAEIPGEGPQDDALSLRRLCHLDRLHVNFVGPPLDGDNYFHGQLDLNPDVAVRHGWLTGTNSAGGTIDRLGMTCFFGHTHHQRLHQKTLYKGDEPIGELIGAECGTLAQIKGGLGYSGNPNWQRGAATAHVWPDGGHSIDFARFDGRKLTWRDKRF